MDKSPDVVRSSTKVIVSDRFRYAWRETPLLRGRVRQVIGVALTVVLSIVFLARWGESEAANDELLVGAAGFVALVILIAGEYMAHFLQSRGDILGERLDAVVSTVETDRGALVDAKRTIATLREREYSRGYDVSITDFFKYLDLAWEAWSGSNDLDIEWEGWQRLANNAAWCFTPEEALDPASVDLMSFAKAVYPEAPSNLEMQKKSAIPDDAWDRFHDGVRREIVRFFVMNGKLAVKSSEHAEWVRGLFPPNRDHIIKMVVYLSIPLRRLTHPDNPGIPMDHGLRWWATRHDSGSAV